MVAKDIKGKRAAEQAARGSAPEELEATIVDPELKEDLGAEYELRGDVTAAELEAARSEAADLRERYARLQAEWDNFRKRTAAERADERARAAQKLVEEILPVLDDIERALAHAGGSVDIASFAEGVSAVHAKLLGVLSKHSVEVIDPTGQPFDALKHQSVSHVHDETVPDETVLHTLIKGYEMGGRVLRAATVVVSTGGPRREGE